MFLYCLIVYTMSSPNISVGPPVTVYGQGGQPNMTALQAGATNTAQANALAGLAGGNLRKRRQSKRAGKKKSRKTQKRNKTNKKSSRRNKRKRVKMIGGVGEPIPYNSPMVPYNNGDSQIGNISKTLALAHASSSSQSVGDR